MILINAATIHFVLAYLSDRMGVAPIDQTVHSFLDWNNDVR
jgi:hypothetical protein